MKTRIRSHEIRLRLTQTEASQLAAGHPVEDVVPIGTQAVWRFSVRTGDAPWVRVDQGFELVVGREDVSQWLGSEDERFEVAVGPTRFSIEKDYACQQPRSGEDDTFPHPNPGRC